MITGAVSQIVIGAQVAALQSLSAALAAKAEEINSSLLQTDDDSVANLREKLQQAVVTLNSDIENLQNSADTANLNIKW